MIEVDWRSEPDHVYLIRSLLDGRSYVGVSRQPYRRLLQHAASQSPLGEAIRRDRLESFELRILFTGARAACLVAERVLIQDYKAEFNIQRAAVFPRGGWHPSGEPPVEMHPGTFMRDVLFPEYGLRVAPTAAALGINRQGFINVLEGRSDISRDLAYKLGALLGDAVADFLIAYQHAYDLATERDRREAYKATITPRRPAGQAAA